MYELRWFLKDNKNDWQDVKSWYYTLPKPSELDSDQKSELSFKKNKKVRTEVYFRCREDIGSKISRGALEIKIRKGQVELFHIDAGISGLLEYWDKEKWKYKVNEDDDQVRKSFEFDSLKGKRFRTQKVRSQRKFEVKGFDFIPVDPGTKIAKGFVVELAKVKINHWSERLCLKLLSLQFELIAARGGNEENKKLFKKGIKWALNQNAGLNLRLNAEESMSYPGLFEQLTPVVYQAGAIPFKIEEGSPFILLAETKQKPKSWIFPKGTIGPKEAAEKTALRELFEETGVEGKPICYVDSMEFYARGRPILAKYYLVEYTKTCGSGDGRKTKWFPAKKAIDKLSHHSSEKLLKDAMGKIKENYLAP